MPTIKTVLFLIRDKMGDSLVASNVALQFAKNNPDWKTTILIRDAYSHAIAAENGVETVPFRSSLHASFLAWRWRLLGHRFDVLAVLRGYGKRTYRLANTIPAHKKIVHEKHFAELATEVVAMPPPGVDMPLYEPALRVVKAIAPETEAPIRMQFQELEQRYQAVPKEFVVICPVTDEPRKNIPLAAVDALSQELRSRHPDLKVCVLVRNQKELQAMERQPCAPVVLFDSIPALIDIFLRTAHYYGTDTGLLHLAAGMGIPCTAYFGPTQPHLIMPSKQPNFIARRIDVLGTSHCDQKNCPSASCIARAVGEHIGNSDLLSRPPPIPECPLHQGRSARS